MTARVWLALLSLLSGCGTLLTKVPMPFAGPAPPLNTFPGVRAAWQAIEDDYYIFLLDLPLSFVGDLCFILLQPAFWVWYPWIRLLYE